MEPEKPESPLGDLSAREYMAQLGKKGGSARTEAQRLARQANARRMRELKMKKRYGTLKEPVR